MSDPIRHWNDVWTSKRFEETSWFQADPEPSLRWIDRAIADGGSIERVIDAGCGVSFLCDRLLDQGSEVVGIDIASEAIGRLRSRIAANDGVASTRFTGITGDLGVGDPIPPDAPPASLWHDRAVLHFLDGAARDRYAENLRRHVAPGGHAIIAGFAPEGPERCSGIEVVRASARDIAGLLGEGFTLVDHAIEVHETPWNAEQAFQWTLCRRGPDA